MTLGNQPTDPRRGPPRSREPAPPSPHPTASSRPPPSTTPSTKPQPVEVRGNLLDQRVDVIVNAWNTNIVPQWMLLTQGVSKAIRKAGGQAAFKEIAKTGRLPFGEARWTTAGSLPFKGIIHVAGICLFWYSTKSSVRNCVRNALALAEQHGCQSIAFPVIGSGSTVKIGKLQFGTWGISEKTSLAIIREEAAKSTFPGTIKIVVYEKPRSERSKRG